MNHKIKASRQVNADPCREAFLYGDLRGKQLTLVQ